MRKMESGCDGLTRPSRLDNVCVWCWGMHRAEYFGRLTHKLGLNRRWSDTVKYSFPPAIRLLAALSMLPVVAGEGRVKAKGFFHLANIPVTVSCHRCEKGLYVQYSSVHFSSLLLAN